ncbi:MAG: carboxypeptidase regulatory-like domain-containing protein [Acidobacteria bacterium]|nr:carboxypeptidase regulatory-like domain-containing protein [Acidobacteriota bacterium]
MKSLPTLSDERGNFSFSSIPEDEYLLVSTADGFKKVESDILI